MNMLSLNFYLCVAGIAALYYTFPIKYCPYVLLAGSLGFYCCLAGAIILTALPLIVTKHGNFILGSLLHRPGYPWIVPLGLPFYTMQILSYLADVYKGEIPAEKNLLQYGLFVSFPRSSKAPFLDTDSLPASFLKAIHLRKNLCKRMSDDFVGIFLKMMIADKAAAAVNTVFGNSVRYPAAMY